MKETKNIGKNKKAYGILGIICYIAGIVFLILCSSGEKIGMELSLAGKAATGTMGVLFFFIMLLCLIRYINGMIEEDKELQISERDERNVMIRGKAAEYSMLLTTILLVAVELVLICMQEIAAVILVCGVLIVGNWVQVLLINHYDKRY